MRFNSIIKPKMQWLVPDVKKRMTFNNKCVVVYDNSAELYIKSTKTDN